MRHLTHLLCATAVVAAMTACGSSASTGSGESSFVTGASESRTETHRTGESPAAVFPLTVKRTGGLAGFQDVLVVARDGLVSLTHRGQKRRQCKLTPVALELVTKAASQVPLHGRPSAGTQPSFPDDLVTLVLSPSAGPVRLEALGRGLGSRAQAFQDLFNDLLNGGAAASQRCAPL